MRASDEEVWAEALAGRGHAFGEIFDRHRARVYRHSRGLAPSWSDADDVVAVTFLEAWRRRNDIHFVNGSMLPWLLRTATFTAGNLTRAARRYRAALRRLPAGSAQPDHAEQLDDGEAVAALRGLAPIHQEVLTLCVLEGVSAEDAARIMGVRVGTVKSRLSRAKARLRGGISASNEPTPALRPEGVTDVV
jgi:RNA polymerase sigma factor (sigma-70 family)